MQSRPAITNTVRVAQQTLPKLPSRIYHDVPMYCSRLLFMP